MARRQRLLLWLFHRLYQEWAPLYDLFSGIIFMGNWHKWQVAAAPEVVGPRVLEIGPGTGNLQVALARTTGLACGLDASPRMVQLARRKLQRRGLPANLCVGTAQSLPFRDRSFGTLVATFPAEYVHDPAAWKEVDRVLCPGGLAIVVDGGSLRPTGPVSWLLARMLSVTIGKPTEGPPYIPATDGLFTFTPKRWSEKGSEVWILIGRSNHPF